MYDYPHPAVDFAVASMEIRLNSSKHPQAPTSRISSDIGLISGGLLIEDQGKPKGKPKI